MQIILAKSAGFCYGVKRAIELAKKTLKRCPKPIQMIGDLVHNEFVVNDLKRQGLCICQDIKQLKDGGSFIIKSHGLPLWLIKKLKKRGLVTIDTTCPKVKKVAALGKFLENRGYWVVVFGDKNHDEVKTISSQLKNSLVIEKVIEARKLKKYQKIGLISQTTKSAEEFNELVKLFERRSIDFRYFNTICPASQIRQAEACQLAGKVDLMLVIGSKKSANTRRLYEICRKNNPLTYLVESDNLIKPRWLRNIGKIGLTAGASTPRLLIKRVVARLKNASIRI